jgi:hypothetical protein
MDETSLPIATETNLNMGYELKEILWKQFAASIDVLENAIRLCPDEFWDTDTKFWQYCISLSVLFRLLPDTPPGRILTSPTLYTFRI